MVFESTLSCANPVEIKIENFKHAVEKHSEFECRYKS